MELLAAIAGSVVMGLLMIAAFRLGAQTAWKASGRQDDLYSKPAPIDQETTE
jgi:hypothetical protein